MIEHLSDHSHAIVKNGIVENILVFDSHNSELLEQVRQHFNADEIVCCCDNGIAYVDGTWDGIEFKPKKPYNSWVWNNGKWEAPIACPTDAYYWWDEDKKEWIAVV